MSDNTIYMIPLEQKTIEMEPINDTIYMDPTEGSSQEWKHIGTFTWDAITEASPDFNGAPGDYTGATKRVYPQYQRVKIVAVSGVWRDSKAEDAFCGSLGFKTQDKLVTLGPGSCLDDAGGSAYTNEQDAANNWAGSVLELELGADKTIAWGFYDGRTDNNSGSLTFEIWGR